MSEEQIRQIILEDQLNAFLNNDVDGTVAAWAEDAVFISPGPRPDEAVMELQGREAMRAFNAQWMARFETVGTETHSLIVEGDLAAWQWTIAFRGRRSGRESRLPGVSVVRFRDGQIVYWREYWDPRQTYQPTE